MAVPVTGSNAIVHAIPAAAQLLCGSGRLTGFHAGINIDPSSASKADGEKLGSIMMFNMISAAGTDAHEEGTPEALAAKQDVQTLLGAANSQQLPLHFTRKGDQVRASP